MDNILLVSSTSEILNIISRLLQSQSFSRIVTTQNGNEARRYLISSDFDLIIIDSPLPDEFGHSFALHAAEKTSSGIIMLAKAENLDDSLSELEDEGVFVLPKPISPEFFYQAVKLLIASRKRVAILESENQKLQGRIQEMRLVDRAKCILIQYLNMTESQAHRYIEKQSMDLRQSKTSIAENILKTYER